MFSLLIGVILQKEKENIFQNGLLDYFPRLLRNNMTGTFLKLAYFYVTCQLQIINAICYIFTINSDDEKFNIGNQNKLNKQGKPLT